MNIQFKSRHYLNIFKHPLMGVSVVNWLRILAHQRFLVHPQFWLKTLFIGLMALLNSPFQFYEYIRYSIRIKQQVVRSPVFIVGHPRSGTTHLHYLMSKDQQFGYCTVYDSLLPHVMLSSGKLLKGMLAASMPATRPQDAVKMTIDSPKEEEFAMAVMSRSSYMFGFYFPRNARHNFDSSVAFSSEKDKKHWQKHFKYYIQKLAYKNSGKTLLLKSPANTGRVAEILELFPDARFVHIHRDPFEVYQSTVRLYEKVVPETSFQRPDSADLECAVRRDYRRMYEKYFEAIQELSSTQLIEVSYAELEKGPLNTLFRIYGALDLNNFEGAKADIQKEIQETSDYQKNSYDKLDDSIKEELRTEWGDVASRLGYSL